MPENVFLSKFISHLRELINVCNFPLSFLNSSITRWSVKHIKIQRAISIFLFIDLFTSLPDLLVVLMKNFSTNWTWIHYLLTEFSSIESERKTLWENLFRAEKEVFSTMDFDLNYYYQRLIFPLASLSIWVELRFSLQSVKIIFSPTPVYRLIFPTCKYRIYDDDETSIKNNISPSKYNGKRVFLDFSEQLF